MNRFLAHFVLERKNRLKKYRNRFGGKFYVRENLTQERRVLWYSYNYKWIRNGKIFVKKYAKSRPIKVLSEFVLNELIATQREPIVPAPVLKLNKPTVADNSSQHKPEMAVNGNVKSQAPGNVLPLPCIPHHSPNRVLKSTNSKPLQKSFLLRPHIKSSQVQENVPQINLSMHDSFFEPSTSGGHERHIYMPYYTPYEQTNFRYRNSLLSPASRAEYQSRYSSVRQAYRNRNNGGGGFSPH